MSLILVSLCGLISYVSRHKHLLVHLSCHSITKTKQGPFTRSAIRPGGDVRYHRLFHLDPVVIDSHHQLVQTGSDKAFAMTGFVVVRMCADGIQGVCFWKVL